MKKKKAARSKIFILDTNVLIQDPSCLFNFEENDVIVPAVVVEELDGFKRETSDRGASARKVSRDLDGIFPDAKSIAAGVPKKGGGFVRIVYLNRDTRNKILAEGLMGDYQDLDKPDNRIIATALHTQASEPDRKVILVSKDVNVRIKARTLGIEAQDLHRDKVTEETITERGYEEIAVSSQVLQRFGSQKNRAPVDLSDAIDASSIKAPGYVLMRVEGTKQTSPAKYLGNGQFRHLIEESCQITIRGGQTIKARNMEQRFFLDALYDPEVSLVTCFGKAGTGKTLLAIAAAMDLTINREAFTKILISRAVVPMGKDIGYLKGDTNEKMRPWVQPSYDAVEFLTQKTAKGPQFDGKRQSQKQKGGPRVSAAAKKPHEVLMEAGLLEIEILTYIRGRSIPNSIFILDEGQNISKQEMKTIVTRMSEGAKLIVIGDPDQVDAPYLDSHSNGLVYLKSTMEGLDLHAHVTLTKGERSSLAEESSNRL